MPSVVVKQIPSWQIPQDLPGRPVELTLEAEVSLAIKFDGHGYCLFVMEIDGDYTFSDWYPSLKAAEEKAAQLFGPKTKDWETVGLQ
ncbi:hypothetical protein [Leptothoe sp. PORK10 BA2]|uniref:hypothetical protein n=1 Tax=Leptothoe sp. PORK10 BA2 TaxID=3110254 RepID=UPI002B202F1A|nr:hypothetical protein [Leptothoe sp. PORK10 BA2]MEA5462493.1 hypothetical protein [Leptothoe sp. PORK10 BA2]